MAAPYGQGLHVDNDGELYKVELSDIRDLYVLDENGDPTRVTMAELQTSNLVVLDENGDPHPVELVDLQIAKLTVKLGDGSAHEILLDDISPVSHQTWAQRPLHIVTVDGTGEATVHREVTWAGRELVLDPTANCFFTITDEDTDIAITGPDPYQRLVVDRLHYIPSAGPMTLKFNFAIAAGSCQVYIYEQA